MPNNVTDSPRDEEKWEKAEGIAKKQLGHAPKSDKDWAYVMGIYKKMKPDHQFKSEKSASKKYDHKEWDSKAKKWIYHYDHSAAANAASKKHKNGDGNVTHPGNPKLKGLAAAHVMHSEAAHHARRDGKKGLAGHHDRKARETESLMSAKDRKAVFDHHDQMAHKTKDKEKKHHHHDEAEHHAAKLHGEKEMMEHSDYYAKKHYDHGYEAFSLYEDGHGEHKRKKSKTASSGRVLNQWMARRVVAKVLKG